ncbi:heavy-metal-associated domain-containing protein [Winogradskyella sp.]|uniref:heavy-metal-associated domain-containing protein n=1 Tax=Winogradskyella sp. TaxID=1883156 RepID=UPI0025CBA1FC|nr:heavy-metal-associated domain-containing protein [Winogradskyella sp.]
MRITVHIQNLKCDGCERTIISRLSKVKNISDIEVNNMISTVAFNYHSNHDFEAAKHLLSRIGYPIIGTENKLKTKAQSYLNCAIGRTKK